MSAPAESGRGASPGGPEPALPEAAATFDRLLAKDPEAGG